MRTTLDIADDILFAAKEMARREKKTLGEVVSDLARRAFTQPPADAENSASSSAAAGVSTRLASYGIRPFPSSGGVVTNELIDRIRDEEGI